MALEVTILERGDQFCIILFIFIEKYIKNNNVVNINNLLQENLKSQ